jgi:hypothetical protein
MRSVSFAVALLAMVGVVIQPVVPACAAKIDGFKQSHSGASGAERAGSGLAVTDQTLDEFMLDSQINAQMRDKLAAHAARNEAAILSRQQTDELAQTHPALYGKLMRAYRTASVPNLTAGERKLVGKMTSENIAAFKAGSPAPLGCGERPAGLGNANVKVASIIVAGTLPTDNCSGNDTGAWVVVGLLLGVVIGMPIFCAIAGQLGAAPAFCRGVTGP